VPVIGYVSGINSDFAYGDGGSGGSETTPQDTVRYIVSSRYSIRRTFPLMQTGVGVEFLFVRTFLIDFSASYYTGFKNLIVQNVQYTHNSVTNTASELSKGEMMSLGLSIKYPISYLWKKPKQ
jgi:hypothetical protein